MDFSVIRNIQQVFEFCNPDDDGDSGKRNYKSDDGTQEYVIHDFEVKANIGYTIYAFAIIFAIISDNGH